MKMAIAVVSVLLAGAALAQEGAPPPMPKPGPEHAILKFDEGVWDATVEMWGVPGKPPTTSTGVETNTIGCGGLCLVTDFKGEFMASPFAGHGIAAFDLVSKKYTSIWMDSMSAAPMIGASTYDPASKTMTGWMEGPDMSGKVSKTKSVVEYKDADTRVFTMYKSDGKDPDMRITYKRKK